MAFSRAHLYLERDQKTSYFAKAIDYPARMEILRKLNKDGPCNVKTLRKMHPISDATFSQHLEILREAQLVDCWEIHPHTFYKLNKKNFKKMKRLMIAFLNEF